MQSSAGPAVIPPSARLAGIVPVVVDLYRRIVGVVVVVVERLPLCRGSLSSSGQCRRYGVRCGAGAGAEVEKRGTGALAEDSAGDRAENRSGAS